MTRDRVYYVGAAISLIALCSRPSPVTSVMLVVGFVLVLAGYIK